MPVDNVIFPPYSFLSMAEPFAELCEQPNDPCLPIVTQKSIQAMLLLQGYTNPDPGSLEWFYYLSPTKGDCPEVGSVVNAADWPMFVSSNGEVFANNVENNLVSGFGNVVFLNSYFLAGFDTLADPIEYGECFKWVVLEIGNSEEGFFDVATVLGCTNCFIRTPSSCYQARVLYRCYEDSNSFPYTSYPGTFFNSMLLPIYLKHPQLESEEKSYRKGDGTFIKLYERSDEVFGLETDYMPWDWHKKLKVALGSDELIIQDARPEFNNTDGRRVCTEPYEIEWQDVQYRLAKGNTKVKSSEPLTLTNSNCSTNG